MKSLVYILLGFLFLSSCNSKQGLPQENESGCEASVIGKEELKEMLSSKDNSNVLLIDIRDPHDYAMGHLPNAISIPKNNFFKNKKFEDLDVSKTLVIYGEDGSSAKMIALMAGHFTTNEFYSLGGGFEYIKSDVVFKNKVTKGLYNDEIPLVNFKKKSEEIFKLTNSNPGVRISKKKRVFKKPLVRRKKKGVSGGCG